MIQKFSDKSRSDVYLRCWVNLTHEAILTKSQKIMNLGLSPVHTLDALGSVFIPATRIVRPTDGSNWLLPRHPISEFTTDIASRKRSEQNYNGKTDFETRKENQAFGRQNSSIS